MSKRFADQRFDGLTVLVTGAAGGFGASAAELFAAEGARLVLSDYHAERMQAVAGRLAGEGHEVAWCAGSVAEPEHCRETVDLALERFGRLDVAINNAGIAHTPARTHELDLGEAFACVEVDLMGVLYGMKYQLAAMNAAAETEGRGGAVLNVASLAGLVGAPLSAAYAAAKHGVVGATKTAALEYARRGIRVNALCPSFARTPMVEDGLLASDAISGGAEGAEAEKFLTRGIPMRRVAEVEEVTRQMLWLCDPANTFMTGQAVAVDGGTSAM